MSNGEKRIFLGDGYIFFGGGWRNDAIIGAVFMSRVGGILLPRRKLWAIRQKYANPKWSRLNNCFFGAENKADWSDTHVSYVDIFFEKPPSIHIRSSSDAATNVAHSNTKIAAGGEMEGRGRKRAVGRRDPKCALMSGKFAAARIFRLGVSRLFFVGIESERSKSAHYFFLLPPHFPTRKYQTYRATFRHTVAHEFRLTYCE